MVKQVEEFSAEFKVEPFIRTEGCLLEDGHIPIVNALHAQGRVNSGLSSESPVRRRRETGSVEPFAQPVYRAPGHSLAASTDHIGSQGANTQPRRRKRSAGAVADLQWETTLESGNA